MTARSSVRYLISFIHRCVYASFCAMLGWYSCVFPPSVRWQALVQKVLCYGLTYPIAVIGRLTRPYRGMDVFFDRGGEWCDFCSAQQVLWNHVRFAVPVYVVLFYLPTLALWIVRRLRSKR